MSTGEPVEVIERAPWAIALRERFAGTPRARLALRIAGGAVAVVALLVGLLFTRLFAVERIDVQGLAHLGRDQVVATSGVRMGSPLVRVDGGAVAHRLRSDPYIRSAAVERHWPRGITIRLVERRAVGMVRTDDGRWVPIADDGVALADPSPDAPKLPALLNLPGTPVKGQALDGAQHLVAVAAALPPSLQPRVVQMREDDGTIRLALDAGTVVVIGDLDQLGDKLMAAAAVISHTDPRGLEALDVRSPHLPVATPKGGVQGASTSTSAAPSGQGSGSGGTSTNGSGAKSSTQNPTKSGAQASTTTTTHVAKSTTTSSIAAAQGQH